MPSAVFRGWRLRTVTLTPASRSRCATGRPSVPVPPVSRIDVVMASPFTRLDATGLEYRVPGHRPSGRILAPADRRARDGNALLHARYASRSPCQTAAAG